MEEYAPAPVSEYSAPGYSAPGEVIDIGSLVLPILVVVGASSASFSSIINCHSSIGWLGIQSCMLLIDCFIMDRRVG